MMPNNEQKTMWVSPECDFEELYQSGQYEDMVQLSEENADQLISLCRGHETEELEKSMRYGMVMLSYFERSLQENKESGAVFEAGKLKGYLETLDKLQFAADQDRLAKARAKLLGTKHLDEIVLVLETHGSMSQTDLGAALGLQASTLSEALKKVRKTNLVQASPYGKYKFYSLTEDGVRYGAMLRKEKSHPSKLKAAVDLIFEYLENPTTQADCKEILRSKLSKKMYSINSAEDQSIHYFYIYHSFGKDDVETIIDQTMNSKEQPSNFFWGSHGSGDLPHYTVQLSSSGQELFQNEKEARIR